MTAQREENSDENVYQMFDDDKQEPSNEELLQTIADLRDEVKEYRRAQWESQAQADLAAEQRLRASRKAEEKIAAEDYLTLRGERPKQLMRDFLKQPKLPPIMEGVLAQEVNLLGGPPGQGKSLLARDWSLHVAAGVPWRGHKVQQRPVLWIASEGMHDAEVRWEKHPLWAQAEDRVYMLDAVNLTLPSEVDWLIEEYAIEKPGVITFDVIYGMGMSDDNGVKDALPVISAMKRLSAELGCATLALGHPPHSGGRRFRGSSMWRDLAYTEYHMADGYLSCEKSKIASTADIRENYVPHYPSIDWLTRQDVRSQKEARHVLIDVDFEMHPGDSDSARAERLASSLGVSPKYARNLIAMHRKGAS